MYPSSLPLHSASLAYAYLSTFTNLVAMFVHTGRTPDESKSCSRKTVCLCTLSSRRVRPALVLSYQTLTFSSTLISSAVSSLPRPLHSLATERQLIERIAAQIQIAKPELVPPKAETEGRERTPKKSAVEETDAKAVVVKSKAGSKTAEKERKKNPNPRAPRPPADLLPSLADRWSPYSPAIESGVLIEAVKVRCV